MTLPTWNTAFTDNVSDISADFLNSYVRTQIPKAIDGVGGGTYTPAAAVVINGAGLSATVASGNTLTLSSGSTYTRSTAETLSGAGATTAWRTSLVTDSTPATYDVTYDEFRVPENITAGGGLIEATLRHSTSPTATAGNRIRFSRNGAAFAGSIRFRREDTTLLATMTSSAAGTSFVEFLYCASVGDATARWRVVAWGGEVTIAAVV
jgi:hypothetical protein